MAETYKIETQEELLEKINEEVELLETIFDGEGLVLEKPHLIVVDPDASTTSSNGQEDEDDSLISQFQVGCSLNIKPNIGDNLEKIGLLAHIKIIFDQFYPFKAPRVQFTNKKGLDEELFTEVLDQVN